MTPLCIDLFCGLGGWTDGFLAEGYECRGYDIEAHDYGTGGYPRTLILRDVRSIHGSEFKDATVIVASPPCQKCSYMAMPWKRAKAEVRRIETDTSGASMMLLNQLFNECFRIQREASEAAGHHIPLIVENVRGAQKWVGRARWHYGSFYLWGDVPALMPILGHNTGVKVGGIKLSEVGFNVAAAQRYREGVKQAGISGVRENGKGDRWFQDGAAKHGSRSNSRKAASAMIAKIPFALSSYLARHFKEATC